MTDPAEVPVPTAMPLEDRQAWRERLALSHFVNAIQSYRNRNWLMSYNFVLRFRR